MGKKTELNQTSPSEPGKPFRCKWLVLLLAFLLVFSLISIPVSYILRSKASMENVHTFYEEPKNSIDVIIAGTSHPLFAISPMEIWDEQGIVSFNMCQGGQMLPLTYYFIQEALRLQDPELVVLDLYYTVKDVKYSSNIGMTHNSIDNLRWSPIKIKAILDGVSPANWAEFFFPIVSFHDRWQELVKRDFTIPTNVQRGAGASYLSVLASESEMFSTDSNGGMSSVSKEYLLKIIELCEKENVELLFTVVPYSIGNDNDRKTAEQQLAIYNQAFEIADEHGIPYLNYFDLMDEIGFDLESDMFDETHMNVLGAEKVSRYLADYLAEHYDLPDRREDPEYSRWAADHKTFEKTKRSNILSNLKRAESLSGYFRMLEEAGNCEVYMTLGGQDLSGLTDHMAEVMQACGIDTDLRDVQGQSWVCILDSGENVYEESSAEKIQYSGEYGGKTVKLFSYKAGSYFQVILDGEKVGLSRTGLNIAVYDKQQEKVVDAVTFDFSKDSCTVYHK